MGRGSRRDRRAADGGIVGLADVIAHHGGAVEYDLMTRTRFTLDDLGGELSARALLAFLAHLPPESASYAAIHGDLGGWSRTDMLLARICEAVESIAWMEACRGAKKSQMPKRPPRIVRPGVKDDSVKRIGSDPIPISDFDEWYGGVDGGQH